MALAGLAAGMGYCGSGLRQPRVNAMEAPSDAKASDQPSSCSWRCVSISPRTAADEAYRLYPDGSCMYGVFKGVLSSMERKEPGAIGPFPYDMMKYGHGGCGGWGAICGALNGAAAVFGLFCNEKKACDALIDELFRWYETTMLPEYTPSDAAADKMTRTMPGSILCHLSMDNWCNEADHDSFSSQRKERCRRLTADVAGKVTEILNRWNAGCKNDAAHAGAAHAATPDIATEVETCNSCHGKSGMMRNSAAKMDCAACHDPKSHPPLNP